MDDQRKPRKRRSGVLAGVLAVAAIAVALPVSGAFADGDSSGSQASGGGVQSAPVQDQRDPGPRDRDCPEKRDGQGGSSGSEDAIEL